MKTIVLHAASFLENEAHYYFYRDPEFLGALASQGFSLTLSNQQHDERKPSAVVYLDASSAGAGKWTLPQKIARHLSWRLRAGSIPPSDRWIPRACRRRFRPHAPMDDGFFDARGVPRILLAIEGVMHAPDSHNGIAHAEFAEVLTWNPAFWGARNVTPFRIPQSSAWPAPQSVPFGNRRLLTSVSADKMVAHPLELYTARRQAIWEHARRGPEVFQFFGQGWRHLPAHVARCYGGAVDDKAATLARFRFALAYENAQLPGYITEKVFDVMRSGCVPVYLGAPDLTDVVPAECFIDRRAFSHERALFERLQTMREDEYEAYLVQIAAFLGGGAFAPFRPAALAEAFATAIRKVSNG